MCILQKFQKQQKNCKLKSNIRRNLFYQCYYQLFYYNDAQYLDKDSLTFRGVLKGGCYFGQVLVQHAGENNFCCITCDKDTQVKRKII